MVWRICVYFYFFCPGILNFFLFIFNVLIAVIHLIHIKRYTQHYCPPLLLYGIAIQFFFVQLFPTLK